MPFRVQMHDPPLVTAAIVLELPVDGWTVSKLIIRIRIELPALPANLPAYTMGVVGIRRIPAILYG
jgi:hypothetical protein